MNQSEIQFLQESLGLHFETPVRGLQGAGWGRNLKIAQDAQPSLVTQSNASIPSFLTTWLDPKLIEVLVAPMKAAAIVGNEIKKGDWLTETAMFNVIENTGETSSYGDYSDNGRAGINNDYPQRQSYTYQVITQWGEREMERAGLAKIDFANRTNLASVLILNKFQNQSYFFGVAGLQNYGLLNAPQLPASISPINIAGAIEWADKDALGVYGDIQALFTQLQVQANGLVNLDTPMTLAMSPVSQVALTKTTQFNVNVSDLLKKNFPNMKVETAPEYATVSGQLVQLIANEIDGQRTVDVAFTEKLRAHPIKIELSSFKQKKSQGTWGAIIYRPIFVASMLGV